MYLQQVAEAPCESYRDDSYHEMTADFDVHLATAGRSVRGAMWQCESRPTDATVSGAPTTECSNEGPRLWLEVVF